jgi:hypothetical protein
MNALRGGGWGIPQVDQFSTNNTLGGGGGLDGVVKGGGGVPRKGLYEEERGQWPVFPLWRPAV